MDRHLAVLTGLPVQVLFWFKRPMMAGTMRSQDQEHHPGLGEGNAHSRALTLKPQPGKVETLMVWTKVTQTDLQEISLGLDGFSWTSTLMVASVRGEQVWVYMNLHVWSLMRSRLAWITPVCPEKRWRKRGEGDSVFLFFPLWSSKLSEREHQLHPSWSEKSSLGRALQIPLPAFLRRDTSSGEPQVWTTSARSFRCRGPGALI